MYDDMFIIGQILGGIFISIMFGICVGVIGIPFTINSKHPWVLPLIITLIFSLVFGLFAFSGFGTVTETSQEIYTLGDSSQANGCFMLGSGIINERPVYVYYYKTRDGGFRIDTVSSRATTIYQDENEHPYIKTITTKYFGSYDEISIHVPNNTIIQHYTLDSEL